ncbi:RsmB/NOP family class I SAM-dependent RNA methyltransferase [Candidatus Woesearchaeota archaeon]|jgi:tRNA (cytosine49-C5)-methyltransferase|nr:RsmB/NOP family class I SAM-dependent RNA methyltransferase [Candidatus Woesearchaeota archaeon]MBT7237513.1 RsmB/NOP family class I SAM-dependent RNA methyltransferase [Candidatus Woesearchaeota archaeon]
MKTPEFKEKFIKRYSELTDFEKFKEYSLKEQTKSLRVNTLKVSIPEFKKRIDFKLKQIPWCKEGFFIDEQVFGIGNKPEHGLGYFYVQEASSMIPIEVLNTKPGDFVLDMAAAPGSKTTQIGAKMKNEGFIIANDTDYTRMSSLNSNLQRCGVKNCITTLMQGRFISGFEFDKILVDAPCSGTGTLSKSPRTLQTWNPFSIKRLAGIQKQLIKTAFENLKKGGELVYSTCTLEPEEDEGVISYLLDNFSDAKVVKVNLDLKHGSPIISFNGKEYNSGVKKCLRIWPQDNGTDGFFITKIKKDL